VNAWAPAQNITESYQEVPRHPALLECGQASVQTR
jgi:hypothetical protein